MLSIGSTANIPQVCGLLATYEHQGQGELSSSFPVQLDSPSCFASKTYKTIRGHIPNEHSHILEGLLEEKSLKLHAICVLNQPHISKKRCRFYPVLPCSLDIVVYGPLELLGVIGEWFQAYEVYL